jgi:hypothetical protein
MPSQFVAHVNMELMLHAIPKQSAYHAAIKGRAFWKFGTVATLVPTRPHHMLPKCKSTKILVDLQ